MRFEPRCCPRSDCPSRSSGHHRWCFKGGFTRACDGRTVQRFLCLECHHTFSTQTFRVDYRLKRPELNHSLFATFISKVTHRQAARIADCSRDTVAHRLKLLGWHCRSFHLWRLARAAERRGITGKFQLDELETFEHSRRLAPVTVPVLIERSSYFVVDLRAAPLPCRGNLSPLDRIKKAERERIAGVRKSGSREAVTKCFETLAKFHAPGGPVQVQTDQKVTYPGILKRCFGRRILHQRHCSTDRRDYYNPLFPINHTLAMLRDGISRLVRRSWAASKLRQRLEFHAWIWIAYRNYTRGVTNHAPATPPAMALGVETKQWTVPELCAWRVLPAA